MALRCGDIVEGSKRQTNADYARFLNIAEASLAETEYLLLLALDLGYLSNQAYQPIAAGIGASKDPSFPPI